MSYGIHTEIEETIALSTLLGEADVLTSILGNRFAEYPVEDPQGPPNTPDRSVSLPRRGSFEESPQPSSPPVSPPPVPPPFPFCSAELGRRAAKRRKTSYPGRRWSHSDSEATQQGAPTLVCSSSNTTTTTSSMGRSPESRRDGAASPDETDSEVGNLSGGSTESTGTVGAASGGIAPKDSEQEEREEDGEEEEIYYDDRWEGFGDSDQRELNRREEEEEPTPKRPVEERLFGRYWRE